MAVCFPTDNRDSWLKEFVESSDYMVDQEWVKIFLDESYNCALEMRKLGEDLGYNIFPADPGYKESTFWRIKRYANNTPLLIYDCYAALRAFSNYFVANRVPFFERLLITNLLTDGSKAIGAVGFNYRTGQTYLFKSTAVILAAGTCTFLTDLFDVCGEGYAMAYEAGSRMRSFDRGGARIRPRNIQHAGTLFSSIVNSTGHALGGRLVNSLGETFWKKASAEVRASGRLGLKLAIQKELDEGRIVYDDYSHIAPEIKLELKRLRKPLWKLIKQNYGVDPFERGIPISNVKGEQTSVPDAGHRAGGVEVDHQCGCSIPGLFAVGDNTWPAMSFQHPRSGCNLGWALLSGSRVGKFASEYVASAPRNIMSGRAINAEAGQKIEKLAQRLMRNNGPTPHEVISSLLNCIVPFECVHSHKDSMEKALDEISRIQSEELANVGAKDFHELRKTVQAESMTLTAEMILRSELFREESRCGMRRKDFPMTDNINWLKWVTLEKQDGKMHLDVMDVPTPYIQAPRGIYTPQLHRA